MRKAFFPAALLGLLLGGALSAQSPSLLKDVNTIPSSNPSSYPSGYTHNTAKAWDNNRYAKIGPFIIFKARESTHGAELWKSLPAANSATLIKDIRPGNVSSSPGYFTNFGSKVFFTADDGVHGYEPWITDGTTNGTFLLADCNPGGPSGYAFYPTVMGNEIYWCSRNGNKYDLWKSDGTTAGTKRVLAGLKYQWYYPVCFGNKILFRGYGSNSGYEPWVTDGTQSGTKMLLDALPGTSSGGCYYPVPLGNKCYFFSNTASPSNYALFETDGTTAGTKQVKAGYRGPWYYPIPLGNRIVFSGSTSALGSEPWVTDGTAGGTFNLADIRPGTASGYFSYPAVMGGKVYFQAYTSNGRSQAIWVTDGTKAGTKMVSTKSRYFHFPVTAGNVIFFRGYSSTPLHGYELWKTDGTDAGTVEVKDINSGSRSSYPAFITPVIANKVVFSADDGLNGTELWISDGTASGTKLLQDIYPGMGKTRPSYPSPFLDVEGTTYFTANDGVHGTELWKSDGTPGGTTMVKDIYAGSFSGASIYDSFTNSWRSDGSQKAVALGRILFFRGTTKAAGSEIWKTDGTAAGTVMVKDIMPGSSSGGFYHGCVLGNRVYFFARDASGYGLWKTDGTAAGTVKVKGGFSSFWNYPFPYRGKIYFQGYTSANGREPWVTDGTAAGTMMLKDIKSGSASGYFYEPVVMGGKVYFRAYKATGVGYAVFVTDGTPSGTALAFNLNGYNGYGLTAMGNKLFFLNRDSAHGSEIWVSDGTQAGTKLFKDISPGTSSGYFSYPCVLGNTLFFRARETSSGYELWKTDGTKAGTVLVKDIRTGITSSYPTYITAVGSRHVFFKADDGTHGSEVWKSDGTAAGTILVSDVRTGPWSSYPSNLALSGGRLFFRADDGFKGSEPWVYFPGGTAQSFGYGTNDLYPFTATDPALGGNMTLTVSGMGSGKGALILLAAPTSAPAAFGESWLHFNPLIIYMGLVVTPAGGGSTTLTVPNDPALVGAKIASQAFVYPTATPPIGVDFTNGVLLTFGN